MWLGNGHGKEALWQAGMRADGGHPIVFRNMKERVARETGLDPATSGVTGPLYGEGRHAPFPLRIVSKPQQQI